MAFTKELNLQIEGHIVPLGAPVTATGPDIEQFIAHGRLALEVGWLAIEVYPLLPVEHWKAECAPLWAELDVLASVAQHNLMSSTLEGIDGGRGPARKKCAALLQQMEALLAGPEEPVHQFLKQHPELICPTSDRRWSKLRFGDRVSDFVFREPTNDYTLVEIEAPHRELFRRDGQMRHELTHAVNQMADWVGFIADHKDRVETELGLAGISTTPKCLVVMGRSTALTEENRRKLVTLQAQQPRLRIMTYDELLATARANFERLFAPLGIVGQDIELYFFKADSASP